MDMQGTPIGSTNQGMKNTTDPSAQIPTQESAGAVAADSLAAESTRSGGAFSENRNSEPSGVKGANSTYANTDTSGATTLPPADSAASRDDQSDSSNPSGPGGEKYAEALGGQPDFPGTTSPEGYVGGSTASKQGTASSGNNTASSSSGGQDSSTDDSSIPQGETAPSYVSSQYIDGGKPKGKNLTEGGFDADDSKNTSFTSLQKDAGDPEDPGRESVKQFEATQAQTAGRGPIQGSESGDGQYGALGGDESLE